MKTTKEQIEDLKELIESLQIKDDEIKQLNNTLLKQSSIIFELKQKIKNYEK